MLPPGCRLRDGVLRGRAVRAVQRARGEDHLHLVVERDDAEAVGGVQAVDERDDRVLRRLEALAGHRAAAVEHDLHGRGRARTGVRRRRRVELEHEGDLVGLFDGDDVEVEMGVHVHAGLLARKGDARESRDEAAI